MFTFVLNHDLKQDSELWAIYMTLQMRRSTQDLAPVRELVFLVGEHYNQGVPLKMAPIAQW